MNSFKSLKSKFNYYIWHDYIKTPILNLYYTIKGKIERMLCKPKYQKHHYLQEVFGKEIPFPFSEKNYPAFDDRDTFNFDDTLVCWIYERLRFFQDYATKIVDFKAKTFEIDGQILTQEDCIDRMVCDCKKLMRPPEFEYLEDTIEQMEKQDKYITDAANDLFKVLAVCYPCMWW